MTIIKINIPTATRNQVIDITATIQAQITSYNIKSGTVLVYSPHTTAAISVNENADPAVKSDMLSFLSKLIPQESNFNHLEGNSDAHIKGGLMNFSQTFIIEDGQLQLGTWQGIFFVEFDGPRQRQVWLKVMID